MSSILPAYARALVAVRMAGHHPLRVNVLYGDDWAPAKAYAERARDLGGKRVLPFSPRWSEVAGDPWVVVSRRQYVPGSMDFRCVAGALVTLHDPGRALDRFTCALRGPVEFDPIFDLVGELARWACVFVAGPPERSAAALAATHADFRAGRWIWPRWWSEDLEREHDKRYEAWTRAIRSTVEQRAA